jgi:hypothetical protein
MLVREWMGLIIAHIDHIFVTVAAAAAAAHHILVCVQGPLAT